MNLIPRPFRRGPLLTAACALILIAAGCTQPAGDSTPAPNVLLISIDTLRADRVGAYGATSGATPNLDALAAEGTRFATAIAPTPLTLPSHTTLLTGLYPPRHGVRHNGMFRLADSVPTLATRLKDSGYATAAFIGAFVLQARFGLANGFDLYDDVVDDAQANEIGYRERPAEVVTQRALEWLKRTEKPFFAFVHFYDPHYDYTPPAPFAERFADDLYSGEIAYVDHHVGRLIEFLRQADIFENTIVVVTSDHGESLEEHGEPTHSYTIYDATQRVPLIVRGPQIPSRKVVTTPATLVDIAPTILARVGADEIDSDGRDLSGLWQTEGSEGGREIYAETMATQLDHGLSALYSVRDREHLYIRAPRPELYDLTADPAQLVNLVESDPEQVAEVVARMDSGVDRFLSAQQAAQRVELDEETLERLRALGYAVQPEPSTVSNIDPKDGLVWALKYFDVSELVQHGRFEEARAILVPMLEVLPESAWGHYSMARVYAGQGDPARGLPHAEKAATLVPGYARFQFLYGDLLSLVGRSSEARQVYEHAIELAPESPPALYVRMVWASESGDVRETVRLAGAILDSGSTNLHNLLGASRALYAHDQVEAALRLARAAVDHHPSSEEARATLAIRLARVGRFEEAEKEWKKAGDTGRSPDRLNDLARAYALAGERARAAAIWEDIADEHDKARENLALLRQLETDDQEP